MDGWLAHGKLHHSFCAFSSFISCKSLSKLVSASRIWCMDFSVDFDGSMIWLCLRRDMDAAAHCVLKNASCKHGYWSLKENQGDIRCIDFVKIGFFSKWISKNDKALSTRQISRLIALQHVCIQECEIAAIAQVFFLGQNITCIASERLWASIGLFELGNPKSSGRFLLPRLQLQSSHVPSPGPTCCILGSYCDFWGVWFMFGHIASESKNDQWLTETSNCNQLSVQSKPTTTYLKASKVSLVNLGYTAKYLPESIHIVKHSWSMYFYWGS